MKIVFSMKLWMVAGLLAIICWGVYWPQKKAEFVLDDYYTVVRNPLIKNPSLIRISGLHACLTRISLRGI